MSTRGFVGFKYKNKIKGWYNHYDSYPNGGLGDDIIKKIKKHSRDELFKFFFNKIKFSKNEKNYDNHKSIMDEEWNAEKKYCLEDGKEFYKDGLFCEFAYIFDFDNNKLGLYKGFGNRPTKGFEDWYYGNDNKYYVNRILQIPFKSSKKMIDFIYKKFCMICEAE
jgi:hypothetical protein